MSDHQFTLRVSLLRDGIPLFGHEFVTKPVFVTEEFLRDAHMADERIINVLLAEVRETLNKLSSEVREDEP